MREWRAKNPGADRDRYRSNDSFRAKRRARVRDRVREKRRSGKKPCQRCGAANAQIHHVDYENPGRGEAANITWLCARCHGTEHYPEATARAEAAATSQEKLRAIVAKYKDR